MFEKPSDFSDLIDAYLEDKSLFPASHKLRALGLSGDEKRLQFVADILYEQLQQLEFNFLFHVIAAIDALLIEKKLSNNKSIKNRINKFKKKIANAKTSNWKDTLLDNYLDVEQNHSFVPLTFTPNAEIAIKLDQSRFVFNKCRSSPTEHSYAVMGSIFATNRDFILKNSLDENGKAKTSHILDAIYAAYVLDDSHSIKGAVIAVGDGCGGHFGVDEQDNAIARSAHFAVKYSARFMASIHNPDALKDSIHTVIVSIGEAVCRKYPRNSDGIPKYQEGTTLAALKIFKMGNEFRAIGFNIGDSMILAWDPVNKRCQTLLPAHVTVSPHGQEATAIFPYAYKKEEIQIIDTMLEPETIVIPLTDGVYDDLPCNFKMLTTPSGEQQYRETCVDEKAICKLLSPIDKDAPVQEFVTALIKTSVDHVETRREKLVNAQPSSLSDTTQDTNKNIDKTTAEPLEPVCEDIQIGDDVAICGLRLR